MIVDFPEWPFASTGRIQAHMFSQMYLPILSNLPDQKTELEIESPLSRKDTYENPIKVFLWHSLCICPISVDYSHSHMYIPGGAMVAVG